MVIIAKLSFWIMNQTKKSIIGSFGRQSLKKSLMNAFEHFKAEGYAEKLKTSITSDSLPSDHQDLLVFMCNLSQITGTSGMCFTNASKSYICDNLSIQDFVNYNNSQSMPSLSVLIFPFC